MEGRHDEQMGSGSGSGGGGEQTSMTLSKYFDEIAGVHCQQAFSCMASFPPDRGAFADTWGATEPVCESNLITAWNPKQVETEIAKGRIMYDGEAAVSCLSGVAFAACPDYWNRGIEWAESCYHVIVPLVQIGGACDNNYSCTTYVCDSVAHTCQ
jgi:hypothetical protein